MRTSSGFISRATDSLGITATVYAAAGLDRMLLRSAGPPPLEFCILSVSYRSVSRKNLPRASAFFVEGGHPVKQLNIVGLNLLLTFVSMATGQVAPQSTPDLSSAKAANAWMRIPTPYLARVANITPLTRAKRDQFWDNVAGPVPLTPESALSTAVSDGVWLANEPEILEVPNRAVLTGTFVSYRSILTASGRAIYTDITFRVHQVLQDHGGHALPGSDITLSITGGTQSGQIISYLTQPRSPFLQPTRSYLLVLSYEEPGDFYTLAGNWDISDGTARPNTIRLRMKSDEGHSSLSGLTNDELIRILKERLSEKR
jgi:hypothetical protein